MASDGLAEAADGYAGALGGDPAATSDHCVLSGPEVRAIDRGWPFDDVQETLAGARNPTAALADWLAQPTDRAALLEPRFGAIGVVLASRANPRLRLELIERTGLSVRVRVRIDPSARGRLRGWLRRSKARHNLRARRLRAGSFALTARVRRPGRWRLVVRFDGAPGWADAALPVRTLRFAARRRS